MSEEWWIKGLIEALEVQKAQGEILRIINVQDQEAVIEGLKLLQKERERASFKG